MAPGTTTHDDCAGVTGFTSASDSARQESEWEAQIDLRLDPVAHFLAVHPGAIVGRHTIEGAIRCDRDHSAVEKGRCARITVADANRVAVERHPVLIDDLVDRRGPPPADAVVKRRVSRAARELAPSFRSRRWSFSCPREAHRRGCGWPAWLVGCRARVCRESRGRRR